MRLGIDYAQINTAGFITPVWCRLGMLGNFMLLTFNTSLKVFMAPLVGDLVMNAKS